MYLNECLIILLSTLLSIIFTGIRFISSTLDNKKLAMKCCVIPIVMSLVIIIISFHSYRYISNNGMNAPNNLVNVEYKVRVLSDSVIVTHNISMNVVVGMQLI